VTKLKLVITNNIMMTKLNLTKIVIPKIFKSSRFDTKMML